jgi:hypothetical protein
MSVFQICFASYLKVAKRKKLQPKFRMPYSRRTARILASGNQTIVEINGKPHGTGARPHSAKETRKDS